MKPGQYKKWWTTVYIGNKKNIVHPLRGMFALWPVSDVESGIGQIVRNVNLKICNSTVCRFWPDGFGWKKMLYNMLILETVKSHLELLQMQFNQSWLGGEHLRFSTWWQWHCLPSQHVPFDFQAPWWIQIFTCCWLLLIHHVKVNAYSLLRQHKSHTSSLNTTQLLLNATYATYAIHVIRHN